MYIQNSAKLEDIEMVNSTMEDYEFYYNLKCEESNIYWSGYTKKPDYNNFKQWYMDNVISKRISFFIILYNNEKVGAIYFNMIDDSYCNYLGLAITERVQGRGIATLAVLKFFEYIRKNYPKCMTIGFYIRLDNLASQKIHAKLGCTKTDKIEERYLESEEKNIIMEFWQYDTQLSDLDKDI